MQINISVTVPFDCCKICTEIDIGKNQFIAEGRVVETGYHCTHSESCQRLASLAGIAELINGSGQPGAAPIGGINDKSLSRKGAAPKG